MGPRPNAGAKDHGHVRPLSWAALGSGPQPTEAGPCLGPSPAQTWPFRSYQAQGCPREDVATVTQNGSGNSRKRPQLCGPEPGWGFRRWAGTTSRKRLNRVGGRAEGAVDGPRCPPLTPSGVLALPRLGTGPICQGLPDLVGRWSWRPLGLTAQGQSLRGGPG